MKSIIFGLIVILTGCSSSVKGPWETLPQRERFVYHHDYRCAEATRIVNGTKDWAPFTEPTVVSINPKTGAYYTFRSVRKKNIFRTEWKYIAVVYEINYPGSKPVITHIWLPGERIPVLIDYYMLKEIQRTPEPDDVFTAGQKATGVFFCAQRKVED